MHSKLSLIFLITCSYLLACNVSYAQNISKKRDTKRKLEQEIEKINKHIDENNKNKKDALINLRLIQKKINLREKLVKESKQQLESLETRIKSTRKEESLLQAKHDSLLQNYSKLLSLAYKTRQGQLWFLQILSSANFSQALRRTAYLRSFNHHLQNKAEAIIESSDSLKVKRDTLEQLKQKEQNVNKARTNELKQLKQEKSSANNIIAKLNRDKKSYLKDLKKKKAEINRLNKEIAKLIQEATKANLAKKTKQTTDNKSSIDYSLNKEFEKNKGKLPWPVNGTVLESFGNRNHPVFKNVKLPFNNGITILINDNQDVKAIFDGVVKQIVLIPGYKQCILIQHGNYFSFYCKLEQVYVKAGDKVKTLEKIGKAETIDGNSQLHFQIWKGSKVNNPEEWLK